MLLHLHREVKLLATITYLMPVPNTTTKYKIASPRANGPHIKEKEPAEDYH